MPLEPAADEEEASFEASGSGDFEEEEGSGADAGVEEEASGCRGLTHVVS